MSFGCDVVSGCLKFNVRIFGLLREKKCFNDRSGKNNQDGGWDAFVFMGIVKFSLLWNSF